MAFIFIVLGVVIFILGLSGWPDSPSDGFMVLFIGYPLILIGVIITIVSWIRNRKKVIK